jgi:hypothetical protein
MTLDSRKNFLLRPDAKTWTDVVDSEKFQAAATAALVIMQSSMGTAPDLPTSSAYYWRLEGARQYLHILMSLTEPKAPAVQKPKDNLEFFK